MSKGVKFLLIGCLSVVIVCAIAVGFGTYMVGSWFKKKTDTFGNLIGSENSEYGKKMAELKKEYPFSPPAENIITDDQLVRFLAVRKSVYQVWKNHEAEFKKISEKKDQDLSTPLKSLEVLNEARMAQAQALSDNRMNPDEYKYLAEMIYTTWIATTTKEILKDKSIREAGKEQLQKQIEMLDKQIRDPNTNDMVRKQLQATRDELQKQLQNLDSNVELTQADNALNSIPRENIALFKKHEAEIKEYSMAGLELIGL